ncbi:cytochrome P450 [Emericellopsis atlantica]|uniref:Cytochrome P450 n=1 Tax=Emericellopsis atlantica TaxID=2614577 RepID=A0A9P8CTS2_9HYPO|nr:cytochrome P450 [Emericellopsis atlantica]KAG9258510.1 cytochrome P450 [Emericellopsis atlantica]
MFDHLPRAAVLAPTTLFICYVVYLVWEAVSPRSLPNLPVVGSKRTDWLPLFQARWRNSTNYGAVASEINTIYKDKPCLVPVGGSETIVLLPASETQHIVDQSDAVLNMPQPMIQGLQWRYTVHNRIVYEEPLHLKIVSSNLTHQLGNLIPDMATEAQLGLDELWDADAPEYREVVVFETMRRIVGRISNRVFVGLPVGRDPALVDAGTSYAAALPQEAGKIRMYPSFLKPLVAPFFTKKTWEHTQTFYRLLKPEIDQRLHEYEQGASKSTGGNLNRNDFLEWSIPQAKAHPNPAMAEPATLAGRVLMLNFGAIHTTSFTLTHALFDLFSSSQDHVDALRKEILSVLSEHGGEWCRKSLARMEKLDSVVRESLRLNMASTFGVPRLVVGKDGFATQSGIHIPKGNVIAVPGKNIARDDVFFAEAETYKPFRFVENTGKSETVPVKKAKAAAATTTADYLPFGHGRHACPGRFFAVAQMKLVLGYLIMNYDIEMLYKRPADIYIGVAKLPPMASELRVRRRKMIVA